MKKHPFKTLEHALVAARKNFLIQAKPIQYGFKVYTWYPQGADFWNIKCTQMGITLDWHQDDDGDIPSLRLCYGFNDLDAIISTIVAYIAGADARIDPEKLRYVLENYKLPEEDSGIDFYCEANQYHQRDDSTGHLIADECESRGKQCAKCAAYESAE